MINSKVEIKTKAGKKLGGWVVDLGRGGVIVQLENGKTLGVGGHEYQLAREDFSTLQTERR